MSGLHLFTINCNIKISFFKRNFVIVRLRIEWTAVDWYIEKYPTTSNYAAYNAGLAYYWMISRTLSDLQTSNNKILFGNLCYHFVTNYYNQFKTDPRPESDYFLWTHEISIAFCLEWVNNCIEFHVRFWLIINFISGIERINTISR